MANGERITTARLRDLLEEASPLPWEQTEQGWVVDADGTHRSTDDLFGSITPDLAAEVIRLREALEQIDSLAETGYTRALNLGGDGIAYAGIRRRARRALGGDDD